MTIQELSEVPFERVIRVELPKSRLQFDCYWKVIRGFPGHVASPNTSFSWIVLKFKPRIERCNSLYYIHFGVLLDV